MTTRLTRRSLLGRGMVCGSALLVGFGKAWPALAQVRPPDALAGGRLLGTESFIHEGRVETGKVLGSELDGRLFTDLSVLRPNSLVTPIEQFYIRTRASQLLPSPDSWRVGIDGLVRRPTTLPMDELRKAASPKGTHVMECAGNVRLTGFAMISAGSWTGVPLLDLVDAAGPNPEAARVCVTGFDQYAKESPTSVAGASWIFSLEELKSTAAFLATELNGQPLGRDHGAPVRLLVPGWYGCTCIKWVTGITLVEDAAEATSQMKEYAARTLQNGVPQLARDYQPAVIDHAAMPVRVEKWAVHGKIKYRVVGLLWGGSVPVKALTIRFNPEEEFVPVDNFHFSANAPWTLWSHTWSPREAGTYTIRLAIKDPRVRARRLDSGYYARTVEISEV